MIITLSPKAIWQWLLQRVAHRARSALAMVAAVPPPAELAPTTVAMACDETPVAIASRKDDAAQTAATAPDPFETWRSRLPAELLNHRGAGAAEERARRLFEIAARVREPVTGDHLKRFITLAPAWSEMRPLYGAILLRHMVWASRNGGLSPHFRRVRDYLCTEPAWPSGTPINWGNAEGLALGDREPARTGATVAVAQAPSKANHGVRHPWLTARTRQERGSTVSSLSR